MRLLNKLKRATDPRIGKTVIRFTTHGCMATEHEFDYIGTIVDTSTDYQGYKFYIVDILKCGSRERRDGNLQRQQERVFALHMQSIGGDFFVVYG